MELVKAAHSHQDSALATTGVSVQLKTQTGTGLGGPDRSTGFCEQGRFFCK